MSDISAGKFRLTDQVNYVPQHIGHTDIINTPNGAIMVLAFDANVTLPTHTAHADVLIQVLEGSMDFHREDEVIPMTVGDCITMVPDTHHSLHSITPLKVLVTKINA